MLNENLMKMYYNFTFSCKDQFYHIEFYEGYPIYFYIMINNICVYKIQLSCSRHYINTTKNLHYKI